MDFKNVLAGVGGMCVLMIVVIVGMFTNANNDFWLSNNNLDSLNVSEPTGGDLACNTNIFENTLNIPLQPSGYGYMTEIDEEGNIYIIAKGQGLFKYDKDGKLLKSYINIIIPSQNTSPYFDFKNGFIYMPTSPFGYHYNQFIEKFDLDDNPIPPRWVDTYTAFLTGDENYVYGIVNTVPGGNLDGTIKKFAKINGDEVLRWNLPEKLDRYGDIDTYPDIDINKQGILHIPMNKFFVIDNGYTLEKGRRVKLPDTYRFVSGILRYDSLGNKLGDLYWYDSGVKNTKIETEIEKNTISRLSIAGDGSIFILNDKISYDKKIIKKLSPNGDLVHQFEVPASFISSTDIKVDEYGNIFISSADKVAKYSELCGKIVVKKIVEPSNLDKSFTFSKNFLDNKDFELKDNGIATFSIYKPAKDDWFTIKEKEEKDYETSVSCVDPSGDSKPGLNSEYRQNVQIRLNGENYEEISCIFTNKFKLTDGKITIIKDTEPNRNTPFDFTFQYFEDLVQKYSKGFALIDDGLNQNSKQQFFSDLPLGKYVITETTRNPDYDTEIVCIDSKGNKVASTLSGSNIYHVTLILDEDSPSRDITCTFKNKCKTGRPCGIFNPEVPKGGGFEE